MNEVLVNIPKPNYENEGEEDVMDVDMVQLKKSDQTSSGVDKYP